MQTVLLLLLSRNLGLGDAGYGYVLAGLGVGGILGTTARRPGRPQQPTRARSWGGALLVVAVPASLMAVTPWLPGLLLLAVLGGAGAVLVEVLCETRCSGTWTRRSSPAPTASPSRPIGGIVGGSLVAAPLVAPWA